MFLKASEVAINLLDKNGVTVNRTTTTVPRDTFQRFSYFPISRRSVNLFACHNEEAILELTNWMKEQSAKPHDEDITPFPSPATFKEGMHLQQTRRILQIQPRLFGSQLRDDLVHYIKLPEAPLTYEEFAMVVEVLSPTDFALIQCAVSNL